jgi:hypothetical protein
VLLDLAGETCIALSSLLGETLIVLHVTHRSSSRDACFYISFYLLFYFPPHTWALPSTEIKSPRIFSLVLSDFIPWGEVACQACINWCITFPASHWLARDPNVDSLKGGPSPITGLLLLEATDTEVCLVCDSTWWVVFAGWGPLRNTLLAQVRLIRPRIRLPWVVCLCVLPPHLSLIFIGSK